MFFCQGPIYKEIITNMPLSEKNRKRLLREYVFQKGECLSVRRRPEYAFVCGRHIHGITPPLIHVSGRAGSAWRAADGWDRGVHRLAGREGVGAVISFLSPVPGHGRAGPTRPAGATGHRRRRPTYPQVQGNEAEATPGIVDDGELGKGSCVLHGGRSASVKMEPTPWWIRRRTELRERCAGEWVELWWWREREGMLGSLEFEQRPSTAKATIGSEKRLSGSGERLGRASGV